MGELAVLLHHVSVTNMGTDSTEESTNRLVRLILEVIFQAEYVVFSASLM